MHYARNTTLSNHLHYTRNTKPSTSPAQPRNTTPSNHLHYPVTQHSDVAVRTSDSQSREPGFESSCCRFEDWAISFTPRCFSSVFVNEHPARCVYANEQSSRSNCSVAEFFPHKSSWRVYSALSSPRDWILRYIRTHQSHRINVMRARTRLRARARVHVCVSNLNTNKTTADHKGGDLNLEHLDG